jgi:hypothetical protein
MRAPRTERSFGGPDNAPDLLGLRAEALLGQHAWPAPTQAGGEFTREMTVPKSRTRNKTVYTPPPRAAKAKVSPRWLAPTMVGAFLVGLVWIIVFYVSSEAWPVGAIGAWNLVLGFVFLVGGLGLATKWR